MPSGGKRPGSGRKAGTRRNYINVKVSDEAVRVLEQVPNKSEFIDTLIIESTIKGSE